MRSEKYGIVNKPGYGFVKRGGGITAHSDGRERGGAQLESFAAQTGPIPPDKFQRPARLRNPFVPAIHR